jgi:hypothetical protein
MLPEIQQLKLLHLPQRKLHFLQHLHIHIAKKKNSLRHEKRAQQILAPLNLRHPRING